MVWMDITIGIIGAIILLWIIALICGILSDLL